MTVDFNYLLAPIQRCWHYWWSTWDLVWKFFRSDTFRAWFTEIYAPIFDHIVIGTWRKLSIFSRMFPVPSRPDDDGQLSGLLDWWTGVMQMCWPPAKSIVTRENPFERIYAASSVRPEGGADMVLVCFNYTFFRTKGAIQYWLRMDVVLSTAEISI